ncbi:TetM/TetW/TetO/TetS family tetracycline resistance ribosomal protection protein [Paenibacillus sp. JCM 10914]|uniref:elongation factor G n=1 Tax=Paenibacillus sp. JCM 10914 TaxID=1236974 RepID=UPI0003CC9D03|nr:TetM/TetW/TetO/TetS family tetracycline resistance ribosomal protection protein [Paenibacillus sp. JCM 10914]GAE05504.1 ribosome protection-type tetracycline resistance related proteins [Paenibacillus sp. JCM 10914]
MKNIVNIGVLAHVDAGKTTLTEQILYRAGILKQVGSVDQGNTTTDSLDMERRRGITIKAAAVSFMIGALKVNLIDTPGHADFISEVEHSLSVLDGVILVISAVEGVQAQTRVLMQTLKNQGIPTLLFLNKIDRIGADYDRVCTMIRRQLDEHICEIAIPSNEGTTSASVRMADPIEANWIDTLALHDEDLLQDYVQDIPINSNRLKDILHQQTKLAHVFPLFVGSAAKGVGVEPVIQALADLFPVQSVEVLTPLPLSGLVFKVVRQENGELSAYARIFAGSLHTREEIVVHAQDGETSWLKVKQLHRLHLGRTVPAPVIEGGDIAIITSTVLKVGDVLGSPSEKIRVVRFHKPPLQVRVMTERDDVDMVLHQALSTLTIEDPFLQYHYDAGANEHMIHVFGRVQQEVLMETVQTLYGIEIQFSPPTVMCIEKVVAIGEATESINETQNPFHATVGLRVEPGAAGSGVEYRLEVELGSLPLSFHKAIKETVYENLQEGLYGWPVTDILITLTHTGYSSPVSTAGDFRSLTPLVFMKALDQARTEVYEPVNKLYFAMPESSLSKVMSRLSTLEGAFAEPQYRNGLVHLEGSIPVRTTDILQAEVHSLTSGEGILTVRPGGYAKVLTRFPVHTRRQVNALHRSEYMMHLNKIM